MERSRFAKFAAMGRARRELNRWAKRDEAEASGVPLEPRHPARMVY